MKDLFNDLCKLKKKHESIEQPLQSVNEMNHSVESLIDLNSSSEEETNECNDEDT